MLTGRENRFSSSWRNYIFPIKTPTNCNVQTTPSIFHSTYSPNYRRSSSKGTATRCLVG